MAGWVDQATRFTHWLDFLVIKQDPRYFGPVWAVCTSESSLTIIWWHPIESPSFLPTYHSWGKNILQRILTPHWHNRSPLIQQAEVHHSPLDSILATKQVGCSWNRTQDILMLMHHSTISLKVLKKILWTRKNFIKRKFFLKRRKKRNNHETEKTESESISKQQQ